MDIAVFVSIWSAETSSPTLSEHMMAAPLAFLKSSPDVQTVEFYTPEQGDEPVHDMDTLVPPTLIVQIDFKSVEKAKQLSESESFRRLFTDKQGLPAAAERIDLEILEVVHYDLPGHDTPPPRTAPLSFVVRYYGPVADGRDFVDYYINHHPQIAARFPGIRNVLCYLPLDWQEMGEITDERMFVGNEVVFDDLDSLKAALASDVFPDLRADGQNFKPWGYSSHHPMHREKVYSR